jgi:muramoyltetrapeptide carboxypeptidase
LKQSRNPFRLDKGALVGIMAPGFAVKPALLRAGVRAIERRGYRTRLGEHVLARDGYLAGSDEQRLADLNGLLRDREVDALWFARGGYGTARLLDRVDWRALRRRPKLLIGFSDLTALFCPAIRHGAVCIHGPVVTEMGSSNGHHAGSLRNLLAGRDVALRVRRRDVLREGRSVGRLVGGNLTVLCHLLGTRHAPDLRGAVLFLEEAGEQTYRVDRMLTQLRMSGALEGVKAVLLGAFRVPARRRFPADRELDAVLREAFLPLGVPVVQGIASGHLAEKISLPLGGTARIDTRAGRALLRPAT